MEMGDQPQSRRRDIQQLSVAIETIAKRMDAQFILDDAKVESFMEANPIKENDSEVTPLRT
jgi:hypothetical protein